MKVMCLFSIYILVITSWVYAYVKTSNCTTLSIRTVLHDNHTSNKKLKDALRKKKISEFVFIWPQLEKTHKIPPSSRDEGHLFLHGLESSPKSSLQTSQEAWLPLGHKVGSKRCPSRLERRAESFASLRHEAWLPGWVWNANLRSLWPLERNIRSWTQATNVAWNIPLVQLPKSSKGHAHIKSPYRGPPQLRLHASTAGGMRFGPWLWN